MKEKSVTRTGALSPWSWVPSLYFAEGLPYVAVMSLATIMYKRLGLDNTDIALYTSWLYLPWVIKPIWSPVVDIFRNKRWWIILMQMLISMSLAGIAFTLDTDFWIQASLAFFWLMAFASATNDIATDGFYMLGLTEHQQAWCVGVRNTSYRIAMISGEGLLVILAGWYESRHPEAIAWSRTFTVTAVLFLTLTLYHKFILPRPEQDKAVHSQNYFEDFLQTFTSFLRKKDIWRTIIFLMTFRFAEAQLKKISGPFLLDSISEGGLNLSTATVGASYGTIGVIALIIGGIAGGIAISRQGLKFWLWPMALSITLPNAGYWYLAYTQTSDLWIINSVVAIEQLGYGFGFTAYTLYMIHAVQGEHKTSHYAICTAFMALGMMIPGMFSGYLENIMGYQLFFLWVLICSLPVYLGVKIIKIDNDFAGSTK